MADVFISFSFKDQQITENIVNKLSNEYDLTCWICTHDIRAGEKFKQRIRNAIAESKVLVFIQSISAVLSDEIPKEISLALSYRKIVIPFIIEPSSLALNGDLEYDLADVQHIDATKPTFDERIAELAASIKSNIRNISVKISEKQFESARSLSSTPISSVIDFIGRNQELEEIKYALSRRFSKVALVGIGGIGKSELAKKYAELHADEYSSVLWIPFEKSLMETFVNDSSVFINGMRRSDYPNDSDREYFEKKLLKLRELSVCARVLLIIDNFNVSDDKDLELLCRGEYFIIFTTKNLGTSEYITYIEVSEIKNMEMLIELFRNEYKRSLTDDDIDAIKKIINTYHGHTLGIRLIASVARSRRISPCAMYEILSKRNLGESETAREKKAFDDVFETIKHVFSMAELSDDEKTILSVLSLIPSCGITVELLHELCGIEDYGVTDGLVGKSWIIHNTYTDEVYLHPIVAEISLDMAHKYQDVCAKFFTNLLDMTEMDVINDDYKKRQLNLKLIKSVDDRVDGSWLMKKQIRYRYAKVLYDNAQYKNGAEIFCDLLKTETEPALILHCYEKIAQSHVFNGEYEEGCKVAERGWEYAKTLRNDEIDALTGRFYVGLQHRLIESYRGIGDYEKSLFYGNQCLENCADYYNTYRGDSLAWTKYHIGRTLLMKGDYAESEKILLCAVAFFEKSKDKNGYSSCCALLGLIYAKKVDKNFEKAISYISEAKKIRLEISEDNSVDYIELVRMESDIYREMGDIQKCKELILNALEMYRKNNCWVLAKEMEVLLANIDGK